jgi:hypothetical protein
LLGLFAIFLGTVTLIGFFSFTYIAGFGFLGGFYGFILIAIGLSLILPKKERVTE